MRLSNLTRAAIAFLAGAAVLSCSDAPTRPNARGSVAGGAAAFDAVPASVPLVISQVYGGGGNSGATFTNDFVELFNPGTSAVAVDGWSVQYASASGTSWAVTPLAGTVQPGAYYLVQEAAGSGGTTALPTPDATGSIAMSASAGKIALANTATAFSGACPAGASLVDEVSFGGTSSNCGAGTTGSNLSNTTAAVRNGNGCEYSATDLSTVFTNAAPTPRNAASPTTTCGAPPVQPASVTVTPSSASVVAGGTSAFTAAAFDASSNPVGTTFTWTTSDPGIATVDASGVVTGVAAGGPVTVTATTPNGVHASAQLTVTAAPPPVTADVVISQVYGGGGNSGATYTNDYVELFNHGTNPVDLTNWTVNYTSAAGTVWQSTTLAGTIQPGHYFLVQEGAGSGGTVALVPDASGAIAMGASSGKIVLAQPGVVLAGACPSGPGVQDVVGYGSSTSSTACNTEWGGRTSTLSNTLAAFRENDGCVNTGNAANDFVALSPNPRNSSNHKDCTQPPRTQSTAKIAINEIMSDPANATSASWGQWFEVHNYGTTPVDLNGWTIISGGTSQPNHVISSSVVVPAGGYAVLGRGADETQNGGVHEDYSYFTGANSTIWLDPNDWLMLVDNANARVDSVGWTSVPHGVTKALRDATVPHADGDGSDWGYSTVQFGDGDYGTPGAANGTIASTPPYVSPNRVSFSGRTATDAPLPVGFESQLFATELDPGGNTLSTTVTWTSLTPSIATIDALGVIHALAAGTATFQGTAPDGTTGRTSLPMVVAQASTTAQYLTNDAFGDPVDGDASNDYIVRRAQYVLSYNYQKGTPNWVAYDLNATDITAGQDRCNCFTFDPTLPSSFTHLTTADYTGAGGYAGYGIDRGHMVRSFDRTSGALDNAYTFYLDNVVPQASDLNQGPWANMENYLGDLAQNQNKEVYVYAGPAGNVGTVKGEGKITIPAYTWKIALILPRGLGLSAVHDYRDVQVVAAVMPNVAGVRNVNWQTDYVVTVDSIEHLTGYQFLTALPSDVRRALETNTQPPIAAVNGPYSANEGSPISMSGAASVDPNGSVASYQWSFGDGGTASGATVSHSYATAGSFVVRLVVTDNDGLVDTVATTATVANVAPVIAPIATDTLLPGGLYSVTGSFTDPGAEPWSGTVNYGDGSSAGALSISQHTFTLSHTYCAAGGYSVGVQVTDGLATGAQTASVRVLTPGQALNLVLIGVIQRLIDNGKISAGNGNSLIAKLRAASNQIDNGHALPARLQIDAMILEMKVLLRTGRLNADDEAKVEDALTRLKGCL